MSFINNPIPTDWQETLLIVEQLSDDSYGGGILQAGLIAIDGVIYSGDYITITDETYYLTPGMTVTQLAASINATSTKFYAHVTSNLASFFASAPATQLVVYRRTPTSHRDYFYGTASAIRVAAFRATDYATAREIALPVTAPATKHFGFARVLTREEMHTELEDNTVWRWSGTTWIQIDPTYIYYVGEIVYSGSDVTFADLSATFTTADSWGWARKSDNSQVYLVRRFSLSAGDITDFALYEYPVASSSYGDADVLALAATTATADKLAQRTGTGDLAVPASAASGNYAIGKAEAIALHRSVGTGGAYSDIAAAAASGYVQLISDVTEDSDIALTADMVIRLNGYTLDLQGYQFTGAYNLTIIGPGTLAYSGSSRPCNVTGTFRFRDATYLNTGSANSYLAPSTTTQYIDNVLIRLPNVSYGGIYADNDESIINNVRFYQGGASCEHALHLGSGALASNIVVDGIYNSNDTLVIENKSQLTGLSWVSASSGSINVGGILSNVHCPVASITIKNQTSHAPTISNIIAPSATISLSANLCQVKNAIINTLTLAASVSYCQLSDLRVTAAVTLTGSPKRNRFNNGQFIGGFTTPDQTIFNNCEFGAAAGGGSNTLTITGGTNSQVANCSGDAVYSDGGTTTGISNWVTY